VGGRSVSVRPCLACFNVESFSSSRTQVPGSSLLPPVTFRLQQDLGPTVEHADGVLLLVVETLIDVFYFSFVCMGVFSLSDNPTRL
jgi:hypothetical protein